MRIPRKWHRPGSHTAKSSPWEKIWAGGKWKKEQFFILFFKEPMYSNVQIWLKGYVYRTACFDC